ncbi:MAG TPA: ABC-type transport auxiliary lipoprotein family protein [Xanthobacteraceae bacterium]|nr:ABC-type transport auxiliary lipoprotein family protein [Xanthobacteraceae bacterium]
METRAPYALIGIFVLAVIAAVFGFVYWLSNTGGLGQRAVYQVRFENSVAGLLTGAAVLFNGIRVGEVTDLKLSADDPRQVLATIAVAPSTPVRADTQAGLEFQGLTGVPVIALQGGSATAVAPPGAPLVLVADPASGESMTQAARQALQRVDAVLSENAEPLKNTIANINTFAAALGRNSDKVDGIVAGLERMTGAAPPLPPPPAYDLAAPRTFAPFAKPKGQLAVREPTGPILFDTQRILARGKGGESEPLTGGQWSDNLPKLVQARVIQSFENADLAASVDRQLDEVKADYQLLLDIRSFQLVTAGAPVADVEFTAKIVGDNGRIVQAKTFHASAPAKAADAPAAAAALSEAFKQTATELVPWVAAAM